MPDTAILANNRPSEVRLSPDGNLLYSANSDGFLRVYDMRTGALVNSWDVGQNLGGMDISPDGSFLVIVERNLSTTYRVDTSTGASTSYLYATLPGEGLLFDVAVLSDGTSLFTQNFPGSGSTLLKVLDYDTGTYTAGQSVNQTSVLTRSDTGEYVLIGEANSSGGPLDIYQAGAGIIARTGTGGYNWGIQAFSGSLVAQYIYNEGIHIYNLGLQRQVTLTTWNSGKVTDLAFSPDNAWLYILENESNSIIKVSTADWDIEATIPIAADVGTWLGQLGATNGGRLILDPQERYFSVVTDSKLVVVENPDAPPITGLATPDTLDGALFADAMFGNGGDDALFGFAGNDRLDGGSGADTLTGGAGDDSYFVDSAHDVVLESTGQGQGFDIVYSSVSYTLAAGSEVEILSVTDHGATSALNFSGNGFSNYLYGNAGANVLDGGAGVDVMLGFGGNDIFYVDSVGDYVFEAIGGGFDIIYASTSYALPNESEIEILSVNNHGATTAIDFSGNGFNNYLYGNNGANILFGGGGVDVMLGFGGNDTFYADSVGDYVFEAVGGGFDTIYASTNYALAPESEVELVSVDNHAATTAIDFSGNGFNNYLYGNNGANILFGGAGADVMLGFGGNDTFYVDNGLDHVGENAGGGFDVVYTSVSFALAADSEVETLSVNNHGATTALELTGNQFANNVYGNNGANTLNGGAGSDVLVGFGGADLFAFTTALGATNVDTITDFLAGTDRIALDDAIFGQAGPLGALNANAFVAGTAAADTSDRIIYDGATGRLFYDADGTGGTAAAHFATLATGLTLTAGDFTVI